MADLQFLRCAAQLSSPSEGSKGAIQWTAEEFIKPFTMSDRKGRIWTSRGWSCMDCCRSLRIAPSFQYTRTTNPAFERGFPEGLAKPKQIFTSVTGGHKWLDKVQSKEMWGFLIKGIFQWYKLQKHSEERRREEMNARCNKWHLTAAVLTDSGTDVPE